MPGAVKQLVDTLEADGLFIRAGHPHDAHSRILRLTRNPQAEIDAFEREVVASPTPSFAVLNDRQLTSLIHSGGG